MKLISQFNRRVDRFLIRHPGFGLRNLMLYVVIGNALVYLLTMMDRTGTLSAYLVLVPSRLLKGELWRLVTFVFVPGTTSLISLALLLYFYYFIGSTLEREWGEGRFTVYYLLGMLLNILYCVLASLITGGAVYITGSYLNLSMFFVFATLWPENRVLLFFFIPIKIKWLAYFEAAVFVFSMISGRTLLPLVAVLNYFLFCGDTLWASISPLLRRASPKAVNFRREAAKAQREAENSPYARKCSVCGRTEAAHPELEFRYCSRCSGYHCFCSDHINSHVHFTD